jgi:hypothetical protein
VQHINQKPRPRERGLDDVGAAPGPIRAQDDVVPKDMQALGRERNAQQRAAGVNRSGVVSVCLV